jgi:hypothetical protein
MITILTTTLRIDEDLQETANSIVPYLSPTVQWRVWVNENERRPLPRPTNPYMHFFKGSDLNLYDALNKLASTVPVGYIMVLGAGDKLTAEAPKCFELVNVQQYQVNVAPAFPVFLENRKRVFAPNPDGLARGMTIPHPGLLMPIEMFRELHGFNVGYRIAADYDIICRAKFKIGAQFLVNENPIIVNFKGGGVSELKGDEAQIENALIQLRVTDRTRASIVSQLGMSLMQMVLSAVK